MTYFESHANNTVEIDGIQFEPMMSERVLQIPLKRPGTQTQLQFGIQITNNRAKKNIG